MASQQSEPSRSNPEASDASQIVSSSMTWGKWERSKDSNKMRHYALEIIQHPIRARMCGFGDKDRRPLAPAAIAKMIVSDEEGKPIAVEDIEIDFFVVTCDLWSADGQTEVNLVRNPSSQARRTRTRDAVAGGSDDGEFAAASSSRTNASEIVPMQQPPSRPLSQHEPMSAGWPQGQSGYTQQPPGQASWVSGQYVDAAGRPVSYPDPATGYSSGQVSPHPAAAMSQGWSPAATPHSTGAQELPPNVAYPPSGQQYQVPGQSVTLPPPVQVPSSRPEREGGMQSDYTRTLVGPLTANAARLQDEKKQWGIFFTFQDLSVRTEGTFRLRLRLANVGAAFNQFSPPAPNSGSTRVHTGVSAVLAQTFTEPFTVFSAKKFPGVPQMTALSLEFGKQGQKLPLRNRPGASGKAKSRGDDDDDEGSNAESEEGE